MKQLRISSSWIINGVQSKQLPVNCSEYLNSVNCFEKLPKSLFACSNNNNNNNSDSNNTEVQYNYFIFNLNSV